MYTVRPAIGSLGPLLVCTLTTEDGKRKDFPLVPRTSNPQQLVLWVSKHKPDEREFVEAAQACFEEIERDVQRWFPQSELWLNFA